MNDKKKRTAEATKYDKIYSILVKLGGASKRMRDAFVFYHMDEKDRSFQEWRFQGKLMFGGKYYGSENRVDCYSEDSTQDRRMLIYEINQELKKIVEEQI